ncbi:MAG: GTPase Era [Erysipelotrichia bacterium]|nr:GTPase Era [Erysipelotrichia bacterium]NCC54366.1 GTPase Era [Erysipelotrichia bacterium]
MSYKSGFISIVGRPNAGKSTLLNALLDEKIAIISPKPQTTRNNIQGILTSEDAQFIFIDTPGVHKPKHELGRNMNKGVYTSLQDVDVIYLMVDATLAYGSGDEFLLEKIKNSDVPVFLLLNKCDLLEKEAILHKLMQWEKRFPFAEMIPLSALTSKNLQELLTTTKKYLPEGVPFYPEDMKSDRSIDFRIRECIREKVLYKTQEEIPHSVAVILENKEEDEQRVFLQAVIIVERDSQKGILIGKQATMIRSITLAAQKELKAMLHKKVELELYVRVEKNWRNKESKLNQLGYSDLGEYE